MCDYNALSRRHAASMPASPGPLRYRLGRTAYRELTRRIADGRARRGRDLWDGSPLPTGSLAAGRYMSPRRFDHVVAATVGDPHRCLWCRRPLPAAQRALHARPHNPREELSHHLHPRCWEAWLAAVAVVLGHADPAAFVRLASNQSPRTPRPTSHARSARGPSPTRRARAERATESVWIRVVERVVERVVVVRRQSRRRVSR